MLGRPRRGQVHPYQEVEKALGCSGGRAQGRLTGLPSTLQLPESGSFSGEWKEEPGRLQSMGSLESDTTERLHFHFSLSCIGEENGNPFQCSCLENPRDGEAWWAAIYGVAQRRTRLKRCSSSSSR